MTILRVALENGDRSRFVLREWVDVTVGVICIVYRTGTRDCGRMTGLLRRSCTVGMADGSKGGQRGRSDHTMNGIF